MSALIRKTLIVAFIVGFAFAAPSASASRTQAVKGPSVSLKVLLHNTQDPKYRSPYGAVTAGTKVTLRLRTALKGATAVTLDLLEANAAGILKPSGGQKLKIASHDKKYEYWQTSFTPKDISVYAYYFTVQNGRAKAYYGNNEAAEGGVGMAYKGMPDQNFQLTSYDPSFTAPSWAQDMVIYQILPDRFYNGDPTNDMKWNPTPYDGSVRPLLHTNWNDEPSGYCCDSWGGVGGLNFFGGDLQGIIDKIPYLKSLGVNTLYLNPVFQANTNHKYDTVNYLEIDPQFGTLDTFHQLVTALHANGMRLILDGVFNDTSGDSVYFNRYGHFSDVGAYQSQSSQYYPWYQWFLWPSSYQTFGGFDYLPQLSEGDQVKDFIFRRPDSVVQYWLGQGADGWRLDATAYKSVEFWKEFRQSVKAAYPTSLIIEEGKGAITSDARLDLLGTEFDGIMGYNFRDAVLSFFARGGGTGAAGGTTVTGFWHYLASLIENYPLPSVYSTMNLVDSHDTERVLSDLEESKTELRQVAAFQATWIGAPTIYYGDEAGQTGGGDPDNRRTFPWDHQDTSLEDYYAKVLNIRDANPALRDGTVTPLVLDNANRTFAYLRKDATQSVAAVINDSGSNRKVTLKIPKLANGTQLTEAISGKTYSISGGKVTVPVGGVMSAILVQTPSS